MIQTQLIQGKNQECKALEIFLDNRKILVENLEPFEPLSKYIDADKINELLQMPLDEKQRGDIGIKITDNITLYDYSRPTGMYDTRPISGKSGAERLANIYQDPKKTKTFNTRAYSAFTKKRK